MIPSEGLPGSRGRTAELGAGGRPAARAGRHRRRCARIARRSWAPRADRPLLDERGLADTGVAAHEQHPRHTLAGVVDRAREGGELGGAPHEGTGSRAMRH
jgi:hypothetical protein